MYWRKNCSPVKAILVRVLLKVVAWANLEEEVSEMLSGDLNGDVDPLAGLVLADHDAGVAPDAT